MFHYPSDTQMRAAIRQEAGALEAPWAIGRIGQSTQRALVARQPAKGLWGLGVFAPMPAGSGLAIAPLWPAPNPQRPLGTLAQSRSGKLFQYDQERI